MAGSKAAIPNMAAIKVPFPVGQSLRRRELCRLPHLRAVCAYVALPYSRYVEGASVGGDQNRICTDSLTNGAKAGALRGEG